MPVTYTTKPSAPSGTSLDTSVEDEITVTWADNSSGEDGYRVYLSTDGSNYNLEADVSANTTQYSITGLTDGKKYWVYVAAYTSSGESSDSAESDITLLPPPTSVTLDTVTEDEIDVSWALADDNPNGSVDVLRSADGTTGTVITTNTTLSNTSYLDTGRADGEKYWYIIRRVTPDTSTDSSQVSGVTVLPAPTNVAADEDVGERTLDITYTDNADNEDSHEIYLKETSAGSYTEDGSVGANTTSYTTTQLSEGVTYDIFIRVVTEHTTSDSTAISQRVPKVLSRTAFMDGTGDVSASRTVADKGRSVTLDGTGDVSATRSLSEKQRSLTLDGTGDVQATRTTALRREPTVTFEGAHESVQDLMEVWPDEEALDVTWDYDTDKMGFVSEWLDENSHIGLSDRDGMGVTFNGGLNRTIGVWIEYDGSGNGVPDAISETKQLTNTRQTLAFSDSTMFGKDGQYRVVVHGLRTGDTINQVDIGAVHDNL
jgi:hypothetical protein